MNSVQRLKHQRDSLTTCITYLWFVKYLPPLCYLSSRQTISVSQHWPRAHRYPCDNAPCTGVVCSSPEIVTVGEDGRIIVFRADQEGVIRVIGWIEINPL